MFFEWMLMMMGCGIWGEQRKFNEKPPVKVIIIDKRSLDPVQAEVAKTVKSQNNN